MEVNASDENQNKNNQTLNEQESLAINCRLDVDSGKSIANAIISGGG